VKKQLLDRVEILAIGSELLTPHYQDTNSLFLTQQLNDCGFEVSFKTIVGDDWENLLLSISLALGRAGLILAVGGLGPTADDLTRQAFAKVLRRKLVLDKEVMRRIRSRFEQRKMSMPASAIKQAYVIEGAVSFPNRKGTAPGQWLEAGTKKIVLLPGPPHELKAMFEEFVRPRLEAQRRGYLARKTLKTTGLTESKTESLISDLYPRSSDVKVTLLASPGQIEVHLVAFSAESHTLAEKKLDRLKKRISARLRDYVFSEDGQELEEVVGELLRGRKETLAVAESCSGGLLGHRLTNVPGSSDYLLEGVIAYSNDAKTSLLAVAPSLLAKHGAVSLEVARAMARSIRLRAGSDYGLAVTGIAGPAGSTPRKPVGLVFIALDSPEGTEVWKNLFLGSRQQVKFQSAQKALDMLRRRLLGLSIFRGEKRKK